MTPRIFSIVLIGVLMGTGNWSYAQEAQEAQEAEPAQPPDPATSESGEEEDKVADASADVFIPTEEISEDAAVPFPVDI